MKRRVVLYTLSLFSFVVTLFVSVAYGTANVPIEALFGQGEQKYVYILWTVRLPRVVLAALVGMALALSGAVMQRLLQNPLADPYTLGISSGASVGAVVVLFASLTTFGSWTLPIGAILGAFITFLFVVSFSRWIDANHSVVTLVLTGVMTSTFLSAIVSLLLARSHEELRSILHWLMGSVAMKGWSYTFAFLPFLFVGIGLIIVEHRALYAMSSGEKEAHLLGVSVRRTKRRLFIATSCLTGAAVAVSGMIGFVGLVVPHMTRLMMNRSFGGELPLVAIGGATFLMMTDTIARTIVRPEELPLGVVTALVGAPLFGYLLVRTMKGGR